MTHVASTGVAAAGVTMTLNQVGPQRGLEIGSLAQMDVGGVTRVSMTVKNWYLRFLGLYLQFLDDTGKVIPLASIPEYVDGKIIARDPAATHRSGDSDNEMFVSVVGPIFTVMGVPTWPGFVTPSFNVPASAHTVRILASGLGTGSNDHPDTLLVGAVMTGIINYGVTSLLCAAGAAAAWSVLAKTVIVPLASVMAQEFVALFSAGLNGQNYYTAGFWLGQALAFAKLLLSNGVVGPAVGKLVAAIILAITEGVLEDAIPIVGWIMFGISVAVGEANLIQTSVEIATCPWTYVNDLVFTHDLVVNLAHDVNAGTFPDGADSYTVTALFEDGTPHVQTIKLSGTAGKSLPAVVFPGVALGGTVNVSVAFYSGAPGTTDSVLLGKGTTGLVANARGTSPTVTLEQLEFPIGPSTVYKHTQKTIVDAGGVHRWDPGAAAPTINAGTLVCGAGGTLCAFRSITVRQATSTTAGYLGYAWQAQNANPASAPSCASGGAGQLDQMANLGTDASAGGYAVTSCGFDTPGVRLAYNLLSHDTANFYLDTSDPTALHVRQVTLNGTPGFAGTTKHESFGVFHFPSDVLLLHPAGHLVSISNAQHRIETHPIPRAAMSDADAAVHLIAQVKSGRGTEPGLMTAPTVAAISAEGTILVLEAGDATARPTPIPSRIQAFDVGGNPVQYFPKQQRPYFLPLTETRNDQGWRYLDVAVEYSGFIYVLSYNETSFVYRLDLYHPQQTGTKPVATTLGVNAARLCVDLWRNVYTLNYEVLQRPSPGITEPSVSKWVPSLSG